MVDIPMMGQGPATPATEEDIERDKIGFTGPNLHRRVDPQIPAPDSEEYKPRSYDIGIYGYDSYRTVEIYLHDEESETSEIP